MIIDDVVICTGLAFCLSVKCELVRYIFIIQHCKGVYNEHETESRISKVHVNRGRKTASATDRKNEMLIIIYHLL